jgi:hypothetical protein
LTNVLMPVIQPLELPDHDCPRNRFFHVRFCERNASYS